MKFIDPGKRAEAEVQADLYHILREYIKQHGLKAYSVYLEYTVKNSRFDCVLVGPYKEIRVIYEVKAHRKIKQCDYISKNPETISNKQLKKYVGYGPAVCVVTDANKALEWTVENIFSSPDFYMNDLGIGA